MRLRKRIASNNKMTDEQIAQSIIDNVVNNSGINIHGLLIDPYFEIKEENGQISFSGKFEHLEIDEDTVDLINEGLRNKIKSEANQNKDFEEKVKEAIKNTISKPNHFYNDFLNQLDDLTTTDIDVYVTEKRYLQTYRDSAMITFYVEMKNV
jgi:hypothetical protein